MGRLLFSLRLFKPSSCSETLLASTNKKPRAFWLRSETTMEKKCGRKKTSRSSLALWSSRQKQMARHRVHVSSSRRKERLLKRHVQEKLEELQKLVPGGKDLHEDELLTSAANYIFQLKLQVHVLNTLSKMYIP